MVKEAWRISQTLADPHQKSMKIWAYRASKTKDFNKNDSKSQK